MTDSEKIMQFIQTSLNDTVKVIHNIGADCGVSIFEASDQIIQAFQNGNKLLICGNGGSAADSQHIATELVVRFQKDRPGLPAIALTTDTSILTAAGNDLGFKHIFERQVEALGQTGDIFIGLSTSGSSENVVFAMEKANTLGLVCIAMTGEKSGPLSNIADVAIQIPSTITARVQEGHITVAHLICDIVEREMFP